MLLSLMRKHAKSWLIKFLIGIIAIVFIFYFGYSFKSKDGVKIAYVNGELISGVEYDKTYRHMLQSIQTQYKSVWNENLIKLFDLERRALEKLVDEKLISQEAKKIGLDITEEEVQNQIMALPAFQFKGQFDINRYQTLLHQNRMTPEDFEEGLARELLQKKVEQFLFTLLPVSDQEVMDYYTFANEKVKISYVTFVPENFKENVTIDRPSVEKYFEENKDAYRIPDRIKITYIMIDPESYKEGIKVTEQDIKDYYEDHLDMFKEKKQVKARHILFKVDPGASEEEDKKVKEKALAVLERAKKGEDFGQLVKTYSEDTSAEKGGDLGFFSKGQMVEAFDEAAFKMKKDEISDLVRTPFGYHIIRVDDAKEAETKGLNEVREQIGGLLKDMISSDLAHEKALSLVDQLPYDVELRTYAEENRVTVKQTDYFSEEDSIPDIIGDAKLKKTLFSLENNDTTEVVEFEGKFYIIQVTDRKPSHLPQLDQVTDQVEKDLKADLAMKKAKTAAEAYLNKLRNGQSWENLSIESGVTIEKTEFFKRSDGIPQVGFDPEIIESAFGLGEKQRYPDEVFQNENATFVIRWEGYDGIDKSKYQEEKEKYRQNLMFTKHQNIFQDWLNDLKKRSDIEILIDLDKENASKG